MNPQDLARLETEAAEIIGAVKELFKEFENRLGEVVSVQRIAASESRAEGARAIQQLKELALSARELVGTQWPASDAHRTRLAATHRRQRTTRRRNSGASLRRRHCPRPS